jgi:hypothetical protein
MTINKADPLDCCRSLVLLERLLFLRKIEESGLITNNLLYQQVHQKILRLFYEYNKTDFLEKLQNYYFDLNVRKKTLHSVIEATNTALNDSYPIYKNFVNLNMDKIEATNQIMHEFERIVVSDFPKEVYFATPDGFALFPALKPEATNYGLIAKIDDSRYASTGAMVYYGFNLRRTNTYYYQIPSIYVLAATLHLYALNPPPGNSNEWWVDMAYKEMASLPENLKNFNSIFSLTFEFLELHEQGHALCVNGNKALEQFLLSIGMTSDDFYQTDFATAEDLKSWSRIVNGTCKPRDAFFILGDFLANMAVLLAGIDEYTLTVLKAFNWGFASPPMPNKRPRGRISFLRYAILKDFDNLFLMLEKIFISAKKDPAKTMLAMQEMEFESWQMLVKYFKHD